MSKLMSRHNVTPKEVFATLKPSEQKQYGGRSIVVIERNDGSKKKVSAPGFLNDLSAAMDVFLDCKSYSSTEAGPFGFTFYGIAENTVAAALAFEMAYNLILDWGAQRDGAKNIYYLGVAKGLLDMAYDEKNREQERAKQAEEAELAEREKATELQRQGEIHRLHWHTGSDSSGGDEADVRNHLRSNDMLTVYVDDHCGTDNDRDPKVKEEEDDDTKIALEPDIKEEEEDDDAKNDLTPGRDEEDEEDLRAYFEPDFKEEDDKKINWQGDIEDEIKKLANKSNRSTNRSPSPLDVMSWRSSTALIKFKDTARQIADGWVNDHGIKITKSRAKAGPKNWKVFKQGNCDSRKIDLKRRRIEFRDYTSNETGINSDSDTTTISFYDYGCEWNIDISDEGQD